MSYRKNIDALTKRNIYLKAKIWRDFYMMKGDLMRLEMENKQIEEELNSERRKGAEIMTIYSQKLQELNRIVNELPNKYINENPNQNLVQKRTKNYELDELALETELLEKETHEIFKHLNDPIHIKEMFKDYSPTANHQKDDEKRRDEGRYHHHHHRHHSHRHRHTHSSEKKEVKADEMNEKQDNTKNSGNYSYIQDSYQYSQYTGNYSLLTNEYEEDQQEDRKRSSTNAQKVEKRHKHESSKKSATKKADDTNIKDKNGNNTSKVIENIDNDEIQHKLDISGDVSSIMNFSTSKSHSTPNKSSNSQELIDEKASSEEVQDGKSSNNEENHDDENISSNGHNEEESNEYDDNENGSSEGKVINNNEYDTVDKNEEIKEVSHEEKHVEEEDKNNNEKDEKEKDSVKTPKIQADQNAQNATNDNIVTPKQNSSLITTPKSSSSSKSSSSLPQSPAPKSVEEAAETVSNQGDDKQSSDFNFTEDSPKSSKSNESKESAHLVINGEVDPDFNPKGLSMGDFPSSSYSQNMSFKTPEQISTLPYISYSNINQTEISNQSDFQTPPTAHKQTVQFGTPIPSSSQEHVSQRSSYSEAKPNISISNISATNPSTPQTPSSEEIPSFMKSSSPGESGKSTPKQNMTTSSEPSFMAPSSASITPSHTPPEKGSFEQTKMSSLEVTPSSQTSTQQSNYGDKAPHISSIQVTPKSETNSSSITAGSPSNVPSFMMDTTPDKKDNNQNITTPNISQDSYSFVTNIPPTHQESNQPFQVQTHVPEPLEISPYFTNIGASLLPRHDMNRIVMDTSSSSFISNDSILIE